MRVGIIFFGITRSVTLAIESIRRNIYDCNTNRGFSFFTVASLNIIESVNNPRTGELGVPLNPTDAFLLQADAYTLARQDDTTIAAPLAAAKAQRDIFGNNWTSVRNVLHQLASLHRAWTMCAGALYGSFDYFLFVRPDLIYLDEIRLADIVSGFHGEGNIALPAWHSYGGFNDRFALADATAARHYAERLALVPRFCTSRAFHPETLLAYALETAGCKVCLLPVRAARVRAHGSIKTENFDASVIGLPLKPQRFTADSAGIRFIAEITGGADAGNQARTAQTILVGAEPELPASPPAWTTGAAGGS